MSGVIARNCDSCYITVLRFLRAKKAHRLPDVPNFQIERRLYATGWFWKTSDFACALSWTRWEEIVDFFQGETGFLGHLTYHWSDTVFIVVVFEIVDEFPVIFAEFAETFGFSEILSNFFVPLVKAY